MLDDHTDGSSAITETLAHVCWWHPCRAENAGASSVGVIPVGLMPGVLANAPIFGVAQASSLVFSRISDLGSAQPSPGSKCVQSCATGACDFSHFNTFCQQRVCDQGAMTAPWNGFCAHNCSPLLLRKLYQNIQVFPELRCLHIVGEATEAGVAPSGIEGIPPRVPEATQAGHVPVMKTS